ncbi:MAG: hypothetical protein ACE5HZ_02530 [Fidelibacterota bacterium]
MSLLSFIAILVIPLMGLLGQEVLPQAQEIYRSAYETAKNDGVISDDEQEILTTLRETLGLSAEEIVVIEETLEPTLAPKLDQSGRWPLVAQNMIYAASVYGWMIPYVLDAEDIKWYVGSEMMSLGASYVLTYRLTKNMEISHARAQMMRAGSAVGLWYGYGVNTLFELDDEKGRLWAWVVMASVPAGIYAGDKLHSRWHPSHGQAWSLTQWAELGAYTLGQIHHLVQEEPEQPEWEWPMDSSRDYQEWETEHGEWKKRHVVFSMVGYPLGTYIGHRFFGTRQYSFGDAMMLLQGRWVGWFYGLLTADVLDLDLDGPGSRILRTVGSVGTMVLFDRVVRGYDYSFGEAALTFLGTLSGAAFAAGVSVLAEIDEGRAVEILVMLGGAAGFQLSRSILTPKSERPTEGNAPGPAFSLAPGAFLQGGRLHPAVHVSYNF